MLPLERKPQGDVWCVCAASSKRLNEIDVKMSIDPEATKFGLSVLHARIRIFESILHLTYKFPIKRQRKQIQTKKNWRNEESGNPSKIWESIWFVGGYAKESFWQHK